MKLFILLSLAMVLGACKDVTLPDTEHTFVDVTTGGDHSCAVTDQGEAYCWGRGADGELGNGTVANSLTPARVQSGVTFKAVSAGEAHTCALDKAGRAYCWGWNAFYELGITTAVDTRVPNPIEAAQQFSMISAGSFHNCAVALDSRVFCWGYNRWGQNGNGLTQTTVPPEPIPLQARMVSAGGMHTCAIATNGMAFCWGSNQYGQLGIGSDTLFVTTPMPVRSSLQYISIDAGITHTCAVTVTGETYCWGSAAFGEIGDGARFKEGVPGPALPVRVEPINPVSAVSTGKYFSCALSGSISCWGRGEEGQLGNGNALSFSRPQLMNVKPNVSFAKLSADGNTHACALGNGAVWCWGTGQFGQLGMGARTTSTVPQRIGK